MGGLTDIKQVAKLELESVHDFTDSSVPTSVSVAIKDLYSTDDSKWAATYSRDPASDGHFVYLVKTTKVYCRPVCKARLARRANISFRKNSTEAEAAGYRPCKRCKPQQLSLLPEDEAVTKIRSFVAHSQPDMRLSSLEDMAKRSGLSKWHFHRVFKRTIGLTPVEFARLHYDENF